MDTCPGIQPVEKMVEEVYGQINLGDPRRDHRLLQMANEWTKNPGKSWGQIFGECKDSKGAYRLIENHQVESRDLLEPLEESGGKACQGRQRVYAVHDTLELDYIAIGNPSKDWGQSIRVEIPAKGSQGILAQREAGYKTVIGQRLKQSGVQWTVDGANSIITLRCCLLSGEWEDYWASRATG